MIHNPNSYGRLDRMRDIINDNNQLLMMLARFDISLGFGDNTAEYVCRQNNVDIETFLAVINFISNKHWEDYTVALPTLISYLRNSHAHFINYALPAIKKTLIEGIYRSGSSEIAMIILNYYDDYFEEVRKHMDYEDNVIFTYVENLLAGIIDNKFKITDFSVRHDHMAGKLDDLKELFVYRYNQQNNELINTALYNIMRCGFELIQHCAIENHLLFPNVMKLECDTLHSIDKDKEPPQTMPTIAEFLSDREKEIIGCVAHGLSNKEIADKLCLSFHTITTYRRNISEKLNIHSTAALVIFAIVNNIVDINDITS